MKKIGKEIVIDYFYIDGVLQNFHGTKKLRMIYEDKKGEYVNILQRKCRIYRNDKKEPTTTINIKKMQGIIK